MISVKNQDFRFCDTVVIDLVQARIPTAFWQHLTGQRGLCPLKRLPQKQYQFGRMTDVEAAGRGRSAAGHACPTMGIARV